MWKWSWIMSRKGHGKRWSSPIWKYFHSVCLEILEKAVDLLVQCSRNLVKPYVQPCETSFLSLRPSQRRDVVLSWVDYVVFEVLSVLWGSLWERSSSPQACVWITRIGLQTWKMFLLIPILKVSVPKAKCLCRPIRRTSACTWASSHWVQFWCEIEISIACDSVQNVCLSVFSPKFKD